ncbi:MAG TPA: ABC transporter substrate-binding protein [Hyphomicrobiaceae bacterium]|nr:ABC transporter substrate-binding protein [Hyphomicrobiaceae bacterium]
MKRFSAAAFAAVSFGIGVGALTIPTPAAAQKAGGILKIYGRDNPPSASIHEEATISVNMPFMAIFNNLVMFDPFKRRENLESVIPELATKWAWSADNLSLTFELREGVKWHDGKPFTAADVVCTFDMLTGKGPLAKDMRKNPRGVWYFNLEETKAEGDLKVTFKLKAPQPSFLVLLASGYSPIYPCHVAQNIMRTKPIGTGPFKFAEFKRNESIRVVKNADYWKKGQPYLDEIQWRIIENRSTRVLAFQAGEFDLTFDSDIVLTLIDDMRAKAPKAVCDMRPTGVMTNLIINRAAPPFDNAKLREAFTLALDRSQFNDIIGKGKLKVGAAMLPVSEGAWGLPPDEIAKLPGYSPNLTANIEKAKKIMEGLGYSAAKPLKLKVSTRNISIYRDPAVILIDQLKKIYIEGELDVVDTTIWHAKVTRGDYAVGLNLTGIGVDDPDVNFVENYTCKSERNLTKYCNPKADELIFLQSRTVDLAKRRTIIAEIERILVEDGARPIIYHDQGATCMQPHLKGLQMKENGIYSTWRFDTVWLDK